MTAHDPSERRSTRPIPPPADHERRLPLPWHRPKPVDEDLEAPKRVQRLLDSPSYRQADEDPALLQQPAMRGVRLQLDYWKAEDMLQAHGIEHTIVVFGSTRIPEPAAAQRQLETARAALAASPDNPDCARALHIALRVHEKSRYYDTAREFGRIVGEAGAARHPPRLVIATGGGPGIMEGANRGAFDVGALRSASTLRCRIRSFRTRT